jgi:short-subunit dehydrogenase
MASLCRLLPENNWLAGKRVLITGATSGIGRALALLLAENGSMVIAHGRSPARLDSLIRAAQASNIVSVTGDLAQEQGWRALESVIREQEPEVFVQNAGYNARKDYAPGWTDSEVFQMFQVNLISPILCIRTFAGLPKLAEPRRLALILSTSCHFAREKMGLYVACKTGLMGFGKTLQQEGLELGVRTTLFYPGRTNSGFRENPDPAYMDAEGVAVSIASVLSLPSSVVPFEFTFRPQSDTYI